MMPVKADPALLMVFQDSTRVWLLCLAKLDLSSSAIMSGFFKPYHKWHLKLSQIIILFIHARGKLSQSHHGLMHLPMAYPHNPANCGGPYTILYK